MATAAVAQATPVLTTLATFNGLDGQYPYAGLTLDAAGNLYGTTPVGGSHGQGNVFEIPVGTHAVTSLFSFNGSNAYQPTSAVTLDVAGNIYGTSGGGSGGYGTVFEIAAGTQTLTTLASFAKSNAIFPEASLTFDAAGNLYGTTNGDGTAMPNPSHFGSVFEVAAGTHALTNLVNFNGANGAFPHCSLTFDSAGDLYGTTESGGPPAATERYSRWRSAPTR